ncbi:MAG TPA: murein biosynthesis integral membrane protein MurJ, partial [Planctomycetes bacterium]|nr:murein biosynthesis integral membrane protein MurJ [Planctomycetota bacterium]
MKNENKVGSRQAVRGIVVTIFWTLGSRVLGLIRDVCMTAALGATAGHGNFLMAWIAPNLFRRLVGEGAVSAAIQPALARAREEKGEASAHRMYARFHGVLGLILVGLVVVVEAILLFLPSVLGARLSPDDMAALRLGAILFPYVLPICLTALASAPQHLSGRFSLPALAPALLNVVWIVALQVILLFEGSGAGTERILCVAILFGGVIQWAAQIPGVRAAGWPIAPSVQSEDGSVRDAMKKFLPAMVGLAAVQINFALDHGLVRWLVDPSATTYTFYANRLLQLPLALLAISVATGLMPLFSRLAAEKKEADIPDALRRGGETILLLIFAAGIGLSILALPAVTVLFEHGRFSAEASKVMSDTLRAYLWCLPAAALIALLTRARQSIGDVRGPARAAVFAIPVNLVLNVLLLPKFGAPGAGYATAVALTL